MRRDKVHEGRILIRDGFSPGLALSFHLARPMPRKHPWDGQQKDLPIQAQGPRIDVLHVHPHPGLKIELVPACERPQASQSRPHAEANMFPLVTPAT